MRCCRSFLITTLPPEDSTPRFLLIVPSLCPSGRTPRTLVRLRLRASELGKTRRNTCASARSCPSKNQEKPHPNFHIHSVDVPAGIEVARLALDRHETAVDVHSAAPRPIQCCQRQAKATEQLLPTGAVARWPSPRS